jgi:protein-S-isoprenylcysteine O-methyltransferase Ste14
MADAWSEADSELVEVPPMIALGVVLVILGVASFVLPLIGYQIVAFAPYQPWLGIIIAAVGLITVLFASRRRVATSVVDSSD